MVAIPDTVDAAQAGVLMDELRDALARLRRQTENDPFSNPIQLLALAIKRRLDRGELSLAALEQLIQRLTMDSFLRRSERLGRYPGTTDRAANLEGLRRLIESLARDPESGAPLPFEAFRQRIERESFGIVFTAHPTFSLAHDLQAILVELATGTTGDGVAINEAGRRALTERAARREHRPDVPLDLAQEHRQSLVAIENVLAVLRRIYEIVLEVAGQAYPDRWTDLDPRLVTVASWVGYDLDGRSDIPWTTTFEKRLRVQALQLERYRAGTRRLRGLAVPSSPAGDLLELLEARLALAIKQAEDEIALFGAEPDVEPRAWRRQLARAAQAMHQGRSARLTEAAPLIELLERAIRLVEDPALRRGLCVLRAEMKTHGLGLAHTHTRINARQLHNAVRKAIGMDHPPDDPSHRLTYLGAIGALIDEVRPVRINFGSLLSEKATAKRVFMIVAQMLKYLDGTQPVRFLIAECETGFTLLSALYLAKLFGVEDKVEISPLFETGVGLDQGARVLAEALGVESFRAYVRRHGRLCIQTGFSDAGRHLGQIAAAHAIERLRLAIGRELAAQGLADVELVIFDTHGESIGRGGHPGSLAERLDYIDAPASRAAFARLGVACKQEISFQGGDGYLLFMSPDAALAVTSRILEHALAPIDQSADPFYVETDYVHEFFTVVRRFNQAIMDDPDYGALLGIFGANLLHRSGSRPLRRQHDSWSGQINLEHPSQLRAIPHNAILQQLGFSPTRSAAWARRSPRTPSAFSASIRTRCAFAGS